MERANFAGAVREIGVIMTKLLLLAEKRFEDECPASASHRLHAVVGGKPTPSLLPVGFMYHKNGHETRGRMVGAGVGKSTCCPQ